LGYSLGARFQDAHIEVYDLDGSWEVPIPDVPYPDRTIAHEYFEGGSIPAAAPGFGVKA
jgi:hypothetical protein